MGGGGVWMIYSESCWWIPKNELHFIKWLNSMLILQHYLMAIHNYFRFWWISGYLEFVRSHLYIFTKSAHAPVTVMFRGGPSCLLFPLYHSHYVNSYEMLPCKNNSCDIGLVLSITITVNKSQWKLVKYQRCRKLSFIQPKFGNIINLFNISILKKPNLLV